MDFFTYDHRTLKTRLPVRSALFKQRTGGLVVRWVTTSEYPLLYVFAFSCCLFLNDQGHLPFVEQTHSQLMFWSIHPLNEYTYPIRWCSYNFEISKHRLSIWASSSIPFHIRVVKLAMLSVTYKVCSFGIEGWEMV
jgi:hypothetical protein